MHPNSLPRKLGALPDAVSAGIFLALWLQPMHFGVHGVRNGMLVMLVEFILLHASAMLGSIVLAEGTARTTRIKGLLAFSLLYLVFIAAWCYTFRQWWPFAAFGVLLLAKAGFIIDGGTTSAQRLHQLQSGWAVSTMAYLAGAFMTVFVPLPRAGFVRVSHASLDLPGSGLWVEQPHTVMAFGTFYFGVLAIIKWRGMLLPRNQLPALRSPVE